METVRLAIKPHRPANPRVKYNTIAEAVWGNMLH